MKLWITIAVLGALAACRQDDNPNICCTDEADCHAAQVPVGTTCDPGYACRGHVCVAEVCSTSANCNETAPYCVQEPEGRCQAACTDDSECPGFAQSAEEQFCDAGACVECRDDASDCSVDQPVCARGSCRGCQQHAECASGVCDADGSCAEDVEIARISPGGSAVSDCTVAAPCTLARALALVPVRTFVLVSPGTYQLAGTVELDGRWHFVGVGSGLPTFTNLDFGPIFRVIRTGEVTFDRVRIAGATTMGPPSPDGYGVFCRDASGASMKFIDAVLENNATAGVYTSSCKFAATRTVFRDNGRSGAELVETNATLDGCIVSGSPVGVLLDFGLFTVRNSVFHHNQRAIDLYVNQAGTVVEFNTIVDNADGMICTGGSHPNNIFARNSRNGCLAPCSCPDSIFAGSDLSELKFKAPDASPPDYRLTAGSIAIDAASASTLDHDVDGDPRPQGAARDVGADEYRP